MGPLVKNPLWTLLASHNRKLAQALMLAAVLWFAWRMAGALWLVTGQDPMPLDRPAVQTRPVSALPEVDTSRLAGFSVFRVTAPAAGAAGDAANAPETTLQLRLDGVFASTDRARSGAIISEQSGSGVLYRIGQSLPGGASLESVFADRVVLSRNGSSEVLRFIKTNLLGGDAPADTAPAASPVRQGNAGAQARAMLATAVERLASEPGAYLSEMGLVAGREGYEITDGAPANIRRGLGLKAGDRILRLNGQPLGNPQLDRQLLEQVMQSGHVRVDIRRGSQNLTIEQNF